MPKSPRTIETFSPVIPVDKRCVLFDRKDTHWRDIVDQIEIENFSLSSENENDIDNTGIKVPESSQPEV